MQFGRYLWIKFILTLTLNLNPNLSPIFLKFPTYSKQFLDTKKQDTLLHVDSDNEDSQPESGCKSRVKIYCK